jgi:hypothetical protein
MLYLEALQITTINNKRNAKEHRHNNPTDRGTDFQVTYLKSGQQHVGVI